MNAVSPALLARIQLAQRRTETTTSTTAAAKATPAPRATAETHAPALRSGYRAPHAAAQGPTPAASRQLTGDVQAQRALANASRGGGPAHVHDHRHIDGSAAAKKPIVIEGTDATDTITVKNGKNGGLDIDVNGEVTYVKKEDAGRVVIRAKGGDDNVTVDAAVKHGIRVEGGAGNDTITGGSGNDIVVGGDGNDVIDGRGGNDVLHGNGGDDTIKGGEGRDIIYGHRGNDALEGGDAQDYIDGGSGDDRIKGDGGNDTLIGGRGDDTVDGGAGDDVLAGSSGKDTLRAGAGKNTVYEEAGDAQIEAGATDRRVTVDMSGAEPGQSIAVKGSEDFRDHIDSDLEALRSIPKGREMLGQIDDTLARKNKGRKEPITVTITEGEKLQSSFGEGAAATIDGKKMKPGAGSSSTITFDGTQTRLYDQDKGWNWAPSSVSLGHELLHSLHSAAGTMLPVGEFSPQLGGAEHGVSATAENEERRTVGLDWNRYTRDGEMTDDRLDLSKREVTENGLRNDLGLEKRTHY